MTLVGPQLAPNLPPNSEVPALSRYGPDGAATSSYVGYTLSHDNQAEHFTPIGTLISNLSQRLAREDPALRDLADYYQIIKGSGAGSFRSWPLSIYGKSVRPRVEAGNLTTGLAAIWDEWNMVFY